jgi:methyl-accepting chemotaxis protein
MFGLMNGTNKSPTNAMLENAPTNVVYADKNFNVQYMNPASSKTLKTLEQYLPVKVDELIGRSIDIFHQNPAHQRKILGDPRNLPHKAIIQLGPEKLDLLVSAIYDDKHNYLGPMISWSLVTEKLELQTKTAQVMSMMENSPTNVIYADKDLNVQYMNPISEKTLQTVAQYLPVPVDQIMGKSIDIFHQNPAHQRKILGDPRNLPHQTIIQLGPEKLDLLVSAIYDDDQNYLGPMISWSVVTEKLELETKAAQVMSMMENSPTNVIYADKDLNLQYMNPASSKTLKTLEQYLPVKVDDLVGKSIDIFHQNPAHQRKILGDPRNLPHQATIQLGPEKLDLLVSAIYDNNQDYLGPMVSWSVVTETMELQEKDKKNKETMIAVLDQIGEVVESLAAASEELAAVSRNMEKNAENAANEAKTVSESGKEVSANVNSVAAGTEEMNASITEIAGNASKAAGTSATAVNSAQEANTIIGSLGTSSQEIGEVIKVINGIAEQTNLLALNATIEAARAGEAGKGFAVVANEVKELANQTAKATGEITGKIQTIQSDVGGAVTSIGDVSKVIDEINGISTTIASAVEEQTATTGEMSRNVSDAAKGSQNISENLSSLAEAVAATKQGAGDTQIASADLSKMAGELRVLIEDLKKKDR